jgi:thioesterase domain-containing protein/acyl carrier protein
MDIFGALLNGSTLYPINVKEETPESILQWLIDQEITLYHSTPTVYRYLLRSFDIQKRFPKIRLVVLGGEEVFRQDVELYQKHFEPDCIFINGLGPSESTVTLQYLINGHTEISRTAVPVGYPVEETEILLRNDAGEDAEVYGEISIRSPHIALGYWQQPELTNKVFLPDPEGGDKKIYRSGDMGRLLPDGSIEFMGRKDSQVKIRGIRIEVGEIEVVLGQHPAVSEAVVVPGDDSHSDRHLVGYIVTNKTTSPSNSEIRSFLNQKLPKYMIPSAYVFLDSLPRTPNGKVDHRALPAPDRNRCQPAEALVAPRDELELQLTKIWEKVLGVKNIGMKDNFFDLGGHSLLVMQLFARIKKIFGRDLPLTTLFQAPTVEQLAGILRQEDWSSPWSSLVPIHHDGTKPPFFCVHGCTGKVLFFYELARLLGPDQPFYGLSALGLEKGQVPHTQIEDMAAHYIKEIRTIQSNGPYFIGGSGAGCTIVLEMAQQLKLQGQNVALMALMAPSLLKPIVSSTKPEKYFRSLRIYFRLLNILIKSSPRIPLIKSAFFNRVLWRWKIFHRFIPIEIHRLRRFIDAFGAARLSYAPQAYHGRITCFLRKEYSHNHKKVIGGWPEIADGGLDVRFVPGTILSMWQEPRVQILAEKLTACLNEAQKNS